MSTRATATLKTLSATWARLYGSAREAGIVGNERHRRQGGYHIGREFQPGDNYSVVRPDDRPGNGPDDAAAAIDMSLNPHDMILCTRRLHAAFANANDPRRKYLNAFNGYTGGEHATRFDVYARRSKWASPDHKWHVHLEIRRRYVDSPVMLKAVLSLLRGDSAAEYVRSLGVKPAVTTVKIAESEVRTRISPAWPGRVYRRGDHDPHIAKWQRRMLDRGWRSIGRADGDFGPKTESVVRRWQAYCRVGVDGAIGEITWPLPWTKPLGG